MYMHQDSSSACACTMLRKASRAVAKVYDDALADRGMTTAQFSILRQVSRAGLLPLSRLAEQLVMDRTSLYRALTPIETKGWLTISAGPGKAKLATLTEAGHTAMEAAAADWEDVQRRIVGAIGPDRWAGLEAGLRAMTELAQHAGDAR
jgi:DNA-binding MarR family transcriptional regulator